MERPTKLAPPLALVLSPDSLALRRRLGPLAWAAFETLALGAEPHGEHWLAVGGLRALAGDLGVTKDTSGRAVAELVAAGLLIRKRFSSPDPGRRSGYQIELPPGAQLLPLDAVTSSLRPTNQDTNPSIRDSAQRPKNSDSSYPPEDRWQGRGAKRRTRTQDQAQGRLFDFGVPA